MSLEWSLARTRQDHGVCPTIVLGHNVGEITAACVAGAMSIETGCTAEVDLHELVDYNQYQKARRVYIVSH